MCCWQSNKMGHRCLRKAMFELQEDGEAKLVFWRLHPMDIFRSRTSVRSNSKYQKFPLYSYLVSDTKLANLELNNVYRITFNTFHCYLIGGPGSGKVTYCDNLIQEKKGITHINMMDLLQQYALGNGSRTFT